MKAAATALHYVTIAVIPPANRPGNNSLPSIPLPSIPLPSPTGLLRPESAPDDHGRALHEAWEPILEMLGKWQGAISVWRVEVRGGKAARGRFSRPS